MSPRLLLPLASVLLLGLFTFLIYAFRCGSVTWIKHFTDNDLDRASSFILGPWLPASGRLALALPILVTLTVLALSRTLRHSPPALLALHSISWMLGIITLPIILWARDFALIQISKGLTVVTPGMQQYRRPVDLYEASWFWIIALLSALALFGCLKSSSTRKTLS